MGNLFSYYFNNQKYDDRLIVPLNKEEIQYASITDIDNINSNINILENTTQNSLKNISLDIRFIFKEIENIKINLEKINNLTPNYTSVYVDANSEIEREVSY